MNLPLFALLFLQLGSPVKDPVLSKIDFSSLVTPDFTNVIWSPLILLSGGYDWLTIDLLDKNVSGYEPLNTEIRSKVQPLLTVATNGEYIIRFLVPFTQLTTNKPTADDKALIETLASSGAWCRVRGHTWQEVQHLTLEYNPDGYPARRRCAVCGSEQIKTPGTWDPVNIIK